MAERARTLALQNTQVRGAFTAVGTGSGGGGEAPTGTDVRTAVMTLISATAANAVA